MYRGIVAAYQSSDTLWKASSVLQAVGRAAAASWSPCRDVLPVPLFSLSLQLRWGAGAAAVELTTGDGAALKTEEEALLLLMKTWLVPDGGTGTGKVAGLCVRGLLFLLSRPRREDFFWASASASACC